MVATQLAAKMAYAIFPSNARKNLEPPTNLLGPGPAWHYCSNTAESRGHTYSAKRKSYHPEAKVTDIAHFYATVKTIKVKMGS